MIPQLRVRTEYSFRTAFGPLGRVRDRLLAVGARTAACVDRGGGTWGHAAWEQTLRPAGIQPAFGAEMTYKTEDGRSPRYWILALDPKPFYRVVSADPREVERDGGCIIFAGSALQDPDRFDYIDINPNSRIAAHRAVELARRTGKPLVLTGDNDYPAPEDRDRFAAWVDGARVTPQHIMTDAELRASFAWLGEEVVSAAERGAYEVEERLQGIELPRAPMIHFEGDFRSMVEVGRKYRLEKGHIPEWTPEYQARLEREIELIEEKDYTSYFMIVSDMILWAKERMLVGPARGSSAGSLVCYLMRITEIDPLVHGLIFERFIDVNRRDLPDIDVDFNDDKRELVFDYLVGRYGRDCVARIGSINRLKPRSVMAHVGKKLGIPKGDTFAVLNVLIDHSSGDSRFGKAMEDTLTLTEPGRSFAARWPEEAVLISDLEEHASHSGQHAAGMIVSNEPVTEYCTVKKGIAQVDKHAAAYLNLLKIDALGLRTLGVIEDTGKITPQELYDLKFNDPEVFRVFNEAKFSGIFQFEGAAQRRVSVEVPIDSLQKIDHVTALARPGPLGGGSTRTYIERTRGNRPMAYRHPSMETYLGSTNGVVLYQEQVMRIVRELGQFNWEDTSIIRKAMSGRKGEEFFNRHGEKFAKGAAELGIPEADAHGIWDEICSFGAWGMNKSHTVSYAVISYWCAYMKAHHPLDYAAACLRKAKDDTQTLEILRELKSEGVAFVPFDPDRSDVNWTASDGILVGGFSNLVGIGPVKAAHYKNKRETTGLDARDRERLARLEPKHNELRPAHVRWGHIYEAPADYGIRSKVREFGDLKDEEQAVVIAQLIRLDRRDENEAVRLARRDGVRRKGVTQFLDTFLVDDSVTQPILGRIRPRMWEDYGAKLADRAVPKQDWFLIRGRWLSNFQMIIIEKIRCLTNPEIFK